MNIATTGRIHIVYDLIKVQNFYSVDTTTGKCPSFIWMVGILYPGLYISTGDLTLIELVIVDYQLSFYALYITVDHL